MGIGIQGDEFLNRPRNDARCRAIEEVRLTAYPKAGFMLVINSF